MDRVFSGVQPTGHLHLGNYLGAIRNWLPLQQRYHCMFCIVDLHALTTQPDPQAMKSHTRKVAASYIAAGIDPDSAVIFVQSAVRDHAHLQWMLACMTPLGWLNRMTQFKEKAGKKKDQAVLGLYAYPVLMAADILLYRAHHVPVGEDQKQHLELTRDIAMAFNRRCGSEILTIPEPLIMGPAPRVMSLRDGTAKMSKSDPSDYSRIDLDDDAQSIRTKIRKAKTDLHPLPDNLADLEQRPEAANLLTIHAALNQASLEKTCQDWAGKLFRDLKEDLTEILIEKICPLGDEIQRLSAEESYLDKILHHGAEQAQAIAQETMADISRHLGLETPLNLKTPLNLEAS